MKLKLIGTPVGSAATQNFRRPTQEEEEEEANRNLKNLLLKLYTDYVHLLDVQSISQD
jgi:hypothetical protein